ncbi:MAG: hypothetical protein WD271_15940 [Acidimicrobiia bacterium]
MGLFKKQPKPNAGDVRARASLVGSIDALFQWDAASKAGRHREALALAEREIVNPHLDDENRTMWRQKAAETGVALFVEHYQPALDAKRYGEVLRGLEEILRNPDIPSGLRSELSSLGDTLRDQRDKS